MAKDTNKSVKVRTALAETTVTGIEENKKDTSLLSDGSVVDFEGAHRSPDNMSLSVEKSDNTVETAEPTGNNYQKVFVVNHYDPDYEDQHAANKVAVLQEALNNGSHPIAEPTFDGVKKNADGVSTDVYYSVKVKPAEESPTSAETVAPSFSENIK
jgi:hypothetical protein